VWEEEIEDMFTCIHQHTIVRVHILQ
jgi:hypothetical protein